MARARFAALAFALAFVGAPRPARADDDPSSYLSLGFGASRPRSYIDFRDAGGGRDFNGKAGYVGGLQYLFHPSPYFGLGLEADGATRGRLQSKNLIPGGVTTVSGDSLIGLVVLRLVAFPHAALHPYLLVGGGYHSTLLKLATKPARGFAWTDTGTQEERTFYDARGAGVAAAGRVGLELPLGDVLFLGAEAGVTVCGRARYKPTTQARAMGLEPLQGVLTLAQAGGRLGVRF